MDTGHDAFSSIDKKSLESCSELAASWIVAPTVPGSNGVVEYLKVILKDKEDDKKLPPSLF